MPRRYRSLDRFAVLLILAGLDAAFRESVAQGIPAARREAVVDTVHGVAVADPYRWLEAMSSPETTRWVRAQDSAARRYASEVPGRASIRAWVRAASMVQRYGSAMERGGRLFYLESNGNFGRSTLVVEEGGRRRVLLSADSLGGDTTAVIATLTASEDGALVVYAISRRGSPWRTARIRNVETGRDLRDSLTGLYGARSGLSWTRDGRGFYYERFPVPAAGAEFSKIGGEQLWYHAVGTPQRADRLVLDPGDADLALGANVTADGRWVVVSVGAAGDVRNRVLVRRETTPGAPGGFTPLIGEADAPYLFVGSRDDTFWFQTTRDAPRHRIIAVQAAHPSPSHWRTVVPEADDAMETFRPTTLVGDRFIVMYRHDGWLHVRAFHLDGRRAYDLALPKPGSVWTGFVGPQNGSHAYYVLTGFADPGTLYRLDVATGASEAVRRSALAYNPDDFVTTQVLYPGKDGTRIPMFLSHHRSVRPGPRTPTLMYGYGAWSWVAAPWFRPDVAVWMQMGGVFALPGIRGGGEYGEPWAAAGRGRRKQTTIDDYIAAARWLIAAGRTSPDRLVANAGSASGMVAAAATIQEPSLFGAATIDYPALDMIRFDRFTGGRGWRPEFGSTDDPEDFKALLAYSPYHQAKRGTCYPATMVLPGDRDETTVPMHAYKYVAAMQYAQACNNPVLLRVSWGAGHSAGATIDDSIDNWTDQLAFLVRVLDVDVGNAAATGTGR